MKQDIIANAQVQLPCGCVITTTKAIIKNEQSPFPVNDVGEVMRQARADVVKQALEHACHATPKAPAWELEPMTDKPAHGPTGHATVDQSR